ncbi:hypothetical protein BF49_4249 [Bradyrhizobium sp.]|nr:hypothetical protein BF49_4249 [Bradyrhizobium sp.]
MTKFVKSPRATSEKRGTQDQAIACRLWLRAQTVTASERKRVKF